MKSFSASPPPLLQRDSVPACLQCTCSQCGWLVQCAPDRTQALIYALLCLLVSRIQAKEVGPCLGSIERYDRAGRINIVPDFIFSTHKPTSGTGQARCGAGPASEGMVIDPPCDRLAQSSLNQGVRCYREPHMPLSLDKTGTISLFLTEERLVWYYCYGQGVPGLRSSSLCNIYASHLLWGDLLSVESWQLLAEVYWGNVKNLSCFAWMHLKLYRKVCFSLYTGLMLMLPCLFKVSLFTALHTTLCWLLSEHDSVFTPKSAKLFSLHW